MIAPGGSYIPDDWRGKHPLNSLGCSSQELAFALRALAGNTTPIVTDWGTIIPPFPHVIKSYESLSDITIDIIKLAFDNFELLIERFISILHA